MKFLKKLGTTLLILLVIAAIFGVVVALNWDLFAAMPQRMQQMEQEQKEQEQIAEVTKEMRELLALAWEHFENTNLIEFEISNIYPDTGETADFMYKKNAVDRAQELMRLRQTMADQFSGAASYEKTEIAQKTMKWPDMSDQTDVWAQYRDISGGNSKQYLYLDNRSILAEYDTWYFYEGWIGDQFGYPGNELPFGIMNVQVTDYEKVGTEEIRGQLTTHYIVSHEPMMKLPQELEMQYFHPESATGMSPRDYFSKYVAAEIVENHPELYNGFMELMEQRWYKDNKTHVWLTEDGWLLRIGYPYTFEIYESHFRTFAEWDTYESFEYALTDISYEVTESGEWLEVQTPSAFSQLRPVIKMVDLYYGEEVEPIVIPETYENLAG